MGDVNSRQNVGDSLGSIFAGTQQGFSTSYEALPADSAVISDSGTKENLLVPPSFKPLAQTSQPNAPKPQGIVPSNTIKPSEIKPILRKEARKNLITIITEPFKKFLGGRSNTSAIDFISDDIKVFLDKCNVKTGKISFSTSLETPKIRGEIVQLQVLAFNLNNVSFVDSGGNPVLREQFDQTMQSGNLYCIEKRSDRKLNIKTNEDLKILYLLYNTDKKADVPVEKAFSDTINLIKYFSNKNIELKNSFGEKICSYEALKSLGKEATQIIISLFRPEKLEDIEDLTALAYLNFNTGDNIDLNDLPKNTQYLLKTLSILNTKGIKFCSKEKEPVSLYGVYRHFKEFEKEGEFKGDIYCDYKDGAFSRIDTIEDLGVLTKNILSPSKDEVTLKLGDNYFKDKRVLERIAKVICKKVKDATCEFKEDNLIGIWKKLVDNYNPELSKEEYERKIEIEFSGLISNSNIKKVKDAEEDNPDKKYFILNCAFDDISEGNRNTPIKAKRFAKYARHINTDSIYNSVKIKLKFMEILKYPIKDSIITMCNEVFGICCSGYPHKDIITILESAFDFIKNDPDITIEQKKLLELADILLILLNNKDSENCVKYGVIKTFSKPAGDSLLNDFSELLVNSSEENKLTGNNEKSIVLTEGFKLILGLPETTPHQEKVVAYALKFAEMASNNGDKCNILREFMVSLKGSQEEPIPDIIAKSLGKIEKNTISGHLMFEEGFKIILQDPGISETQGKLAELGLKYSDRRALCDDPFTIQRGFMKAISENFKEPLEKTIAKVFCNARAPKYHSLPILKIGFEKILKNTTITKEIKTLAEFGQKLCDMNINKNTLEIIGYLILKEIGQDETKSLVNRINNMFDEMYSKYKDNLEMQSLRLIIKEGLNLINNDNITPVQKELAQKGLEIINDESKTDEVSSILAMKTIKQIADVEKNI